MRCVTGSLLSCRQRSIPVIPGIRTSSRMRSGASLAISTERLLRRSHVAHRVAEVLDVVPHRLPDQEVVVDDQDPPEGDGAWVDWLTAVVSPAPGMTR